MDSSINCLFVGRAAVDHKILNMAVGTKYLVFKLNLTKTGQNYNIIQIRLQLRKFKL